MINLLIDYWKEIIIFFLVITTSFYFIEHLNQTKEYNVLVDEYNKINNCTVGKLGNSYGIIQEDLSHSTFFNFTYNLTGVVD